MIDEHTMNCGQDAAAHAAANSLFVTDRELHHLLAPHVGRDRFAATIKALEREGFPKTISLFRGRYFPLVKAWLDEKYGMRGNGVTSTAEDGPENFDAPTR